ncbi:hypothetical protein Q8A73_008277 [Channa argus]|nr:hypothetical protein Q8A73_008277 [Channa argus]
MFGPAEKTAKVKKISLWWRSISPQPLLSPSSSSLSHSLLLGWRMTDAVITSGSQTNPVLTGGGKRNEVIEQMSGESLRGDVYTEGQLKPVTLIFIGLVAWAHFSVKAATVRLVEQHELKHDIRSPTWLLLLHPSSSSMNPRSMDGKDMEHFGGLWAAQEYIKQQRAPLLSLTDSCWDYLAFLGHRHFANTHLAVCWCGWPGVPAETDTSLLSLSRREIGLSVNDQAPAITHDHPQLF